MKRKHEAEGDHANDDLPKSSKKLHLSSSPNPQDIHSRFRSGLFEAQTLNTFISAYQNSQPYKHGVIPTLISDPLLRSVRTEILTHISFTPKETDIYKIQQSGDLANLDGLASSQLEHLPNLVKLRDALYSAEFRGFLADVTRAGKLSGRKTDMAINIYTPGSYLLCHDDVIGSRRVSYILYLTDPDWPWQAEWGGGLRLYPTQNKTNGRGETVKVPIPEHVKVIPPSWGQLSFFAVQPGESFHDVEEVYHPPSGKEEEGKKRVRMAISGWYHIPQEGEDGFEEGLEEKLAERSSLSQLQGKDADEFDEPKPQLVRFEEMDSKQTAKSSDRGKGTSPDGNSILLTESDLDLLLQYISPGYLTPETTEQLTSSFEENSFLQLDRFLCEKFAGPLKEFISEHDHINPDTTSDQNKRGEWRTAKPPHKHRFLFQQAQLARRSQPEEDSSPESLPMTKLMTHLFPSTAFRRWLSIITGLKIEDDASFDLLARRFRRGQDYALASAYEGENPRLEFSLGCTASGGWDSGNTELDEATNDDDEPVNGRTNDKERKGKHIEVGGEEVYMAGDDDDDDDNNNGNDEQDDDHDHNNDDNHNDESSNNKPENAATTTTPSAPPRSKPKSDPAIYNASSSSDAILFTDPPSWNRFSIVLRDRGTLRFVKYVSQAAMGDRWDIKGVIECGEGGWGEINGDEDGGEEDKEEVSTDIESKGDASEEDTDDEGF